MRSESKRLKGVRQGGSHGQAELICSFDTRKAPFYRKAYMRKLIGIFIVMLALTTRAGQLVPDFKLTDMNFNSARPMGQVSPRDYLLQVSGYYFGHAT